MHFSPKIFSLGDKHIPSFSSYIDGTSPGAAIRLGTLVPVWWGFGRAFEQLIEKSFWIGLSWTGMLQHDCAVSLQVPFVVCPDSCHSSFEAIEVGFLRSYNNWVSFHLMPSLFKDLVDRLLNHVLVFLFLYPLRTTQSPKLRSSLGHLCP